MDTSCSGVGTRCLWRKQGTVNRVGKQSLWHRRRPWLAPSQKGPTSPWQGLHLYHKAHPRWKILIPEKKWTNHTNPNHTFLLLTEADPKLKLHSVGNSSELIFPCLPQHQRRIINVAFKKTKKGKVMESPSQWLSAQPVKNPQPFP